MFSGSGHGGESSLCERVGEAPQNGARKTASNESVHRLDLVQHLLRVFAELASHRGGQLSRVAASLQASLASHAEIPVQGQQMEHPVTDAAPSVAKRTPERMEEEVLGFQEDLQRCEMQVVDTPGEVVGSTAEHKEEVIASPSVSIGKNEGEMEKPRRRRKKAKLKVDSDDDALEKAIKQAEEERAIEADLMVRVWKKRPEQCQCGRSLPSRWMVWAIVEVVGARCKGA